MPVAIGQALAKQARRHTVDTYHDIQMKGVEFLRNIYASAGFSIRPRSQPSEIEMVKEFVRGLGMNPEEILTRRALSEPLRIQPSHTLTLNTGYVVHRPSQRATRNQ